MKLQTEITETLSKQGTSLESLIDYQAGGIVSREIVRQKTGTVAIFAFDKGQELSEHTAPFDALVQILDGQAEITIAGNPIRVSRGQILLMPANRPHALSAVEKFKMLLTMIRS